MDGGHLYFRVLESGAMPDIRFTPNAAVILNAMVQDHRAEHSPASLSRATSIHPVTARRVLLKLEDAGWLTSRLAERYIHQAPRLFRFTASGLPAARRELKNWTITDPA